MMIREVFIAGKQIDIESNNAAGYIFTSPVFRDITKILSNRTTTYKIPKTSLNLNIFELSDNPDVIAEFPYKEHSFSEYRNGLLFISGICTLLKVTDNELELSVIWGNTINLLSLKDLKLRDMVSQKYLPWNNNSTFLDNSLEDQFGFIVVDFGRGITDFRYIHPSITMKGILDLITDSTGVNFGYPSRFNDVFTKKWIPLLDKKADALTWADYTVNALFDGYWGSTGNVHEIKLRTDDNKHNIIQNQTVVWAADCKMSITVNIEFYDRNPKSEEGLRMDTAVGIDIRLREYFYDRVSADVDGHYRHTFTIDYDYTHTDSATPLQIIPMFSYLSKDGKFSKLNDIDLVSFSMTATVKQEEVQFGDKFPIVPNLPDLSVVDYLKTIMQMFGLYTYYDYKLDDSTIQFISIDDIYSYKNLAYNWTDKLVATNRGKFNLTFIYGDYAQKNNFKYEKDDTVKIDADGFLLIENETILKEKDLVNISFSPSENSTENNGDPENVNIFARIQLYDNEGKTNSVKDRVLTYGLFKASDGETPIRYKSAYFDDALKFSGDKGLLKMEYKAFQHILRRPVIAECYVYLSDFELHNYREVYPIYIDGTYYMPIEITVQTDSLAVCKLIRMPYLDAETLKRI